MTSGVIATLHSADGNRAVKIMRGADGTFGLNEFRRDVEDAGGWTLVREKPRAGFATKEEAVAAARAGWLRDTDCQAKD